jgi:hypothetical protein
MAQKAAVVDRVFPSFRQKTRLSGLLAGCTSFVDMLNGLQLMSLVSLDVRQPF